MTQQQKMILACYEINLQNAKTPQMRQFVQKQINDFKASCQPKPKPTHPAWVDEF